MAKSNKLSGAFVLRLRLDPNPCECPIEGIVEHVESGRTLHFRSMFDLEKFLTDELSAAREGEVS